MRQLSFPPSGLGGYLCPCKLAWPCPLWAGRSQAMSPHGPALVGSLIQAGGGRRPPSYEGASWRIVGLRAGEQDADNNVTAGRCPSGAWGGQDPPWVGMGVEPLLPGACSHSSRAVGSPSPSLALASWEGAWICEVAAWFLSCAGSVLAGHPAASPLPSPALRPADGFWQEPVQLGGWKSLLSRCHFQFCDPVKLISRAVKLLPVGQQCSYQELLITKLPGKSSAPLEISSF